MDEWGFVPTSELGIYCSHCGGDLNMSIPPEQAEQFTEELCAACEALPANELTGMKFTQEQLEAAAKQMQYERKLDHERAQRMCEWLCDQIGVDRKHAHAASQNDNAHILGWYAISPFPEPYHFKFVHQTYGPYLKDFCDKLDQLPEAKRIQGKNGPTYNYVVQTPEGEYQVSFKYFDNHYGGY